MADTPDLSPEALEALAEAIETADAGDDYGEMIRQARRAAVLLLALAEREREGGL